MDSKNLIDSLLASGKSFAEKGRDVAEEKLNIPDAGPERDAMLSGLSKGAMAAGALALLLGTRGGRAITGGAIKLGSLAALGGLAYTTYRNWQGDQTGEQPSGQSDVESSASDDEHSRLILSAMIAAAKADGHINAEERMSLQNYIDKIGDSTSLSEFVESELAKPLDPSDVAAKVATQEIAAEVYLASLLIIDQSNVMAKTYLSELAGALGLPQDLVTTLNGKIEPAV